MEPQQLPLLWHSTSHILAHAVKDLFEGARFAIGPATDEGFYYDFDIGRPFTPEDLKRIEKQMRRIVKKNHEFSSFELDREDAVKAVEGQPFKKELIDGIDKDEPLSFYRSGDFTDLCRGPHLADTRRIRFFRILNSAAAYWRGDEKREHLQRIYGIAFFTRENLDEYMRLMEEARRRDHRRLGRELQLFEFNEAAGPGLVIYHPRGAILRMKIEEYEKAENERRGYQPVITPHIYRAELWKTSGHYDYYRENMFFFEADGQEYAVKPMNCPGHVLVYKFTTRSYRDLPMRLYEMGTVYRHERSGVMHGLMRLRGFTQDDAHIFCTMEQLESEIRGAFDFSNEMVSLFGLGCHYCLSTRPEKSIGSPQRWELATQALKNVLDSSGVKYEIAEGDGAFYGPKIDVEMEDAIGRTWQGPTIQVDFNIPEKFKMAYTGPDGKQHVPVMIHRAVLGSFERFVGVLVEHFAGEFPLWIAPEQVRIMTITDDQLDYAREVEQKLRAEGLRVHLDARGEKIGYKIREAESMKVPYILICGKQEQAEKQVAVRSSRIHGRKDSARNPRDLGSMDVEKFMEIAVKEDRSRAIGPLLNGESMS